VKLRLRNSESHQAFSSVLSKFLVKTHFQHNIFFDGANSELSAKHAILRLRFYGEDPQIAERCDLSLKAKVVLVNGVSRVEEDEDF
jgi:adenylate cyclase class IV